MRTVEQELHAIGKTLDGIYNELRTLNRTTLPFSAMMKNRKIVTEDEAGRIFTNDEGAGDTNPTNGEDEGEL